MCLCVVLANKTLRCHVLLATKKSEDNFDGYYEILTEMNLLNFWLLPVGNNAVFSYSLERAGGKFTVTPAGYILVNDEIDRETEDVHSFQVVAKETKTSEERQAVASVTVNVTDLNDNNPKCSQAVYRVTVPENRPGNTFVVKITASDPDLGPSGTIRFSFVPDANDHYKFFTIDPINGSIYSTASFDREHLALYKLTTRATDQPISGQARFGDCRVEVTISDENDNNPRFTKLPNKTSVSEGASINTVLYRVQAADPDEGGNAVVSYTISAGNTNDTFSLNINSGSLSTLRKLDRETNAQFSLQITAEDGGKKSTTKSLVVHITDVNDNAPVFTEPEGYYFSVDEGKAGLTVGIVTAVDTDEGINAEVIYSLKPVEDYLKFTIDDSSGEIKTTSALDRESADQHKIRVLAKDKGLSNLQAEVNVVINVSDVNDHSPVFSKRHYVVAVKEQLPAHVILNLTATDRDVGINSAFLYSILSGDSDNSFVIDPVSGALSTTGPLDREQHDSYILLIRVSDLHGNNSYGVVFDDSTVVEVVVENTNDHRPLFASPLYHVEIYENITTGTAILKLSAQDRDDNVNMALRYSIVSGNTLERFFIDVFSGVIYVKSSIDRDPPRNESSFLLTIMAKDGGEISFNSTTKVPSQFTVDSSSGVISSYQPFDYDEKPNTYTLTLTATDKGMPPLSGNTTIIVELENVNDNTPMFTQNKFFFIALEGSYVDSSKVVGEVTAVDKDQDDKNSAYGELKYEFVNQTKDAKKFTKIYNARFYRDHQWPLDREDAGKVLDVRAGVQGELKNGAKVVFDPDLGNVVSLEASEAWLLMGDFKDNCISNPSLCAEGLSIAFWVKFVSGQYVISSGGASGFATGFDFYRESAAGDFRLVLQNSTSEWSLKLNDIPTDWFYFTFTWSVEAGLRYFQDGQLIASTQAPEKVTRGSDIFTSLTIGKPNNVESPQYYGNLSVSDLLIWRKRLTDEEVLHSYKISRHVTGKDMPSSPQYKDKFALSDYGVITAIGVLDRETKANYSFEVRAMDLDPIHPRYNTTVVAMQVLDANDNPPVFENASYFADLLEHSSVGFVALQVRADDTDQGVKSVVSYSIVSGNVRNAFTIDVMTGEIKVARDLDREDMHQYVLGVEASDGEKSFLR
ncbi:protocadherin Fat 4-like [Stylophora pistillata]|uniref:protocadherin Fat 4-like n=1 Tax=Stylophora pistillata TaxID=50429 RepID=UPI000C042FC2|nr:protocadherin Fat 4-like [Stylophora pistillata]